MTNKPMLSVERDSIALEALKVARQFIANGIELGYIRMPEPETPDSAHGTLPMIDRAIVELRALHDESVPFPGYPPVPEDRKLPDVQHQGEPVAKAKPVAKLHAERLTGRDGEYGVTVEDSEWFNTCRLTGGIFNLYAEQPAPVAEVPEGYCIMPRRLTAENGAKALLLGEFQLEVTTECPECRDLEEPLEGCEFCDGEGEYEQRHIIPWDQIKDIYSQAVAGLAKINKPL